MQGENVNFGSMQRENGKFGTMQGENVLPVYFMGGEKVEGRQWDGATIISCFTKVISW